jgi:hypothetical protein
VEPSVTDGGEQTPLAPKATAVVPAAELSALIVRDERIQIRPLRGRVVGGESTGGVAPGYFIAALRAGGFKGASE